MNSSGIWFNDSAPRRVTVRRPTLLVGKAPTKQKRIKASFTMALDTGGENQVSGCPDWLAAARDFVMMNGETITANQVVKEVHITMGDENLFKKTPTEAPKSQLDHFQITQQGDSEDPDTVVNFEVRTAFSTDLWTWFGQQSGEEFDISFVLPEVSRGTEDSENGSLELTSSEPAADEDDDDEEEDDASEDEDYETARAEACSPKNDAAFGVGGGKAKTPRKLKVV